MTPQAPETTQTPIPSPQDSSSTEEKSSAKPAAPGQFDVDEESAQRALERTLVQSGALLLQSGQIDLETSLSIIRNQQSVPAFINTDTGLLAASEERRDSTLGAALNLRIGLPFESQLELGLPYQYIDNTSITRVGFEVATQKSTYDDGIGDVSIGIAKTLLKEKGRRPDLIARLSWNADNGDRDQQEGSQGIGSGVHWVEKKHPTSDFQDPTLCGMDARVAVATWPCIPVTGSPGAETHVHQAFHSRFDHRNLLHFNPRAHADSHGPG